jgi:hypothetical protein
MKLTIFLLAIFLLTSCSQNVPQRTEIYSTPVTETSPISSKTESIPDLPTPDANEIEKIKRYIKQVSENFGLTDLEVVQLPKEDLEIRLWQISDLFMPMYQDLGVKKSVFVLTRLNGSWSAIIIRETVKHNRKTKTNIEKTINTKLDEPKTGWENVWQQLVDEEILTLPNGKEVGVLGGLHTGRFRVEIKNNGIYRFYEYNGSYHSYGKEEGFKLIREANQMAKIANIIANEFHISDLKTTVPKLEGYKFPQLP